MRIYTENGDDMTILDLARKFDATDASDIEARIAIAEQMRPVLGDRHDEFDARFTALHASEPGHPSPATEIAADMGLR